jgi:hypothetical protein
MAVDSRQVTLKRDNRARVDQTDAPTVLLPIIINT